MHICKYASMQVRKYSSMHIYKYACMQVWKYACMQVCTYMQVFKYASMQVCNYDHICKYASMQVCKYANMQVCKYVSMHVYASMLELCTVQSKGQIDCMFALRHFFIRFDLLSASASKSTITHHSSSIFLNSSFLKPPQFHKPPLSLNIEFHTTATYWQGSKIIYFWPFQK